MTEHQKSSPDESPKHPIFTHPATVREVEAAPWEGDSRRFAVEWAVGVGADTVLSKDGDYYVEWIEVTPGLQRKGVGTELYRKLETHARRLGADKITALLTSEGSAIAARRAYGGEYISDQSLDEMSRPSDHPDFSGHDHYTPALDYPIGPVEPSHSPSDIEELMGADMLPERYMRAAMGRSAVTSDLDELEHARGSRR